MMYWKKKKKKKKKKNKQKNVVKITVKRLERYYDQNCLVSSSDTYVHLYM